MSPLDIDVFQSHRRLSSAASSSYPIHRLRFPAPSPDRQSADSARSCCSRPRRNCPPSAGRARAQGIADGRLPALPEPPQTPARQQRRPAAPIATISPAFSLHILHDRRAVLQRAVFTVGDGAIAQILLNGDRAVAALDDGHAGLLTFIVFSERKPPPEYSTTYT